MNRRLFLAALPLAVSGMAEAGPGAVRELMAIEKEWNAAVIHGDTAALQRILGPEFVYTNEEGSVSNKAETIASISSGELQLYSASLEEVQVRRYGKVAVVLGRNREKAAFKGKDVGGVYRFTDVFVNRRGHWQCVATQEAKVHAPG